MMIDTHCHLFLNRMCGREAEFLGRAAEAGVTRCVVVGITLDSSRQAIALAEEHPGVWATVGIHPHEAAGYSEHTTAELRDMAQHPKVVALGEMGLDYYRDLSPRDSQERALVAQLALARELGLPVVLHTREATGAILDVLRSHGSGVPGVVHSWSGNRSEVRQFLDLGLMIGYGGIMTYRQRDDVRESLAATPMSRILLETDAPFLSPEPVRATSPNEPANVRHIATRAAEVKGCSFEALSEATTANAIGLFRKMSPADG